MPKVDIATIQNLQNELTAVGKINANFRAIQTVIDTLLSRDGVSPNHMVEILDMNARRIINLPMPIDPTDAARFKEIQDFYALVIAERERAEEAADASEASAQASEISAGNSAVSAAAALVSEENADESEAEALVQANRSESEAIRAEAAADALEVYEINMFFEKYVLMSEYLYVLGVTRPFTIKTDTTGSFAVSRIPALTGLVLSLRKNDVQFGTLTWGAGQTVGMLSVSSETSFANNDLFQIVVSTLDETIQDISVSFLAQRITP